ncbi:GIY-YIG nuclease family protein [Puniceicoccaceae bacterium K14]|nr:GIY-YIG nuclease family protein [Puniceicoccaceae bacterium K14]
MTLDLPRIDYPPPAKGLLYIYIILCDNNTFYVGLTSNVRKRFSAHANGYGSRHTKRHKPTKLVFTEGPYDLTTATNRERQLKKWSHVKKQALITGDTSGLKLLSKSKS